MNNIPSVFKPLGETYKLTISNTVVSLPTIPDGAVRCKIQVESQDVRCKFNATNSVTYSATSGIGGGFILFVNTVACPWYFIEGRDNMSRMRMFRSGSTDSYVNVLFEGEAQPSGYLGGLA
jgi:hypothetical protein